jgi:hypothetical protein
VGAIYAKAEGGGLELLGFEKKSYGNESFFHEATKFHKQEQRRLRRSANKKHNINTLFI